MAEIVHNVPRIVEQELYAMLPPKEHKHIDKYLYILSTVQLQYTFHRKEADRRYKGFVPLMASLFQGVCGNSYKKYIDYLVHHQFLETDGHWIIKSKCPLSQGKSKGYRLHPRIADLAPAHVSIKRPLFLKNLQDKKQRYKPETDVEEYLYNQMADFSIDPFAREYIDIAREYKVNYVERLNEEQVSRDRERHLGPIQSILKISNFSNDGEINRFRVTLPPVGAILMPEYKRRRYATDITLYNSIFGGYPMFEVAAKGTRIFTSFNMQGRVMRQFWRHKSGLRLWECDFSNSQPLFLCTLFADFFGDDIPEDAQLYQEKCEDGTFYEHILSIIAAEGVNLEDDNQRSIFKGKFFGEILFCRNIEQLPAWYKKSYHTPMRKAFEKHFPNVYRLIREYKKNDHRKLAIEMQRRERLVIVEQVCYALIKRFNGQIPLLTIHDSIVTTEPYAEAVKEEMERAMAIQHNITPTVKTKPIQTPPIALYLPIQ